MTIPELYDDLVEEILCRVPARSMKRLQSTSKVWKNLFQDRRFARKHCDKAAKEFLLLMLTKHDSICPISVDLNNPSVEVKGNLSLPDPQSFTEFQIAQVFHCDGLLLCTSKDEKRNVVWNPCTGDTKWIKAGNFVDLGRRFVLGYYRDSNKRSPSYKILAFYNWGMERAEVYEFDSDTWRILDDQIAPGWNTAMYPNKCVSLKGKSYWFAVDCKETNLGTCLLRFDFETEKSEPLALPYKISRYDTLTLSVVKDEKLSVLLQRSFNPKTEVWVTNKIDDGTKPVVSWSLVLALDLCDVVEISDFSSFLLDEEKKSVVCSEKAIDEEGRSMDVIYIVEEDNEVTEVDFGIDMEHRSHLSILNYVPSLVQIEGDSQNM